MEGISKDYSRLNHREEERIAVEVIKNKLVVNFFKEQTCLYIPIKIVKALGGGFEDAGRKKIFQLATKIYTKEVLEDFPWLKIIYQNSLMLDLPPKQNDKVAELKRKIEESYDVIKK